MGAKSRPPVPITPLGEPREGLTVDDVWIRNVPPPDSFYWEHVRTVAKEMQSDGCTVVSDIFIDSCYEHDIHWRTGRTIYGVPITTAQANERFRRVIQSRSKVGVLSPVSWIRWAGVSVGGLFLKHKSK